MTIFGKALTAPHLAPIVTDEIILYIANVVAENDMNDYLMEDYDHGDKSNEDVVIWWDYRPYH